VAKAHKWKLPKSTLTKAELALGQAIEKRHERLRQADYDGVSGLPPAWVTQWHVQDFDDTRVALVDGCGGDIALATDFFWRFCRPNILDLNEGCVRHTREQALDSVRARRRETVAAKMTPEDARAFSATHPSPPAPNGASVPNATSRRSARRIPPELLPHLIKLRDFYRAVQQGENEGLAALAGEFAAHGRKFKVGRERGALGDAARQIDDVLKTHGKLSTKRIAQKLPNVAQSINERAFAGACERARERLGLAKKRNSHR
jgi:hypothetical protein